MKRFFPLILAVAVVATLAGCAAAPPLPVGPPAQRQAPTKPILWRSTFAV